MKELSEAAGRLSGQPMFQLLARVQELQKAGRDIMRFEIGDTSFGVDPTIVQATQQALSDGHIKYVNSQGMPDLREAICEHTERTHGFRPEIEQVIVMPANGVIDVLMNCVVNPGQAVLIPDPGFPTYVAAANHLGITVQTYGQYEGEDRFFIDPKEIDSQITETTRLLISNSPNNPTGMRSTSEEAHAIMEIAEKHDLYLLSDEVYSRLIFSGEIISPTIYDACRERTILLNSFSKGYGMSGWRLGYAIGPVEVISKMTLLFETVSSCVPPFIQQAGVAALKTDIDDGQSYRAQLRTSRDLMISLLNEIPGVSCIVPPGAMYIFANIKATGLTSQQFSDVALEKAGVSLLPGTNFGKRGEGYVRLCFARELETIEEGCRRLKEVFTQENAYEAIGLHSGVSGRARS